ncbi:alkaline shock response membrane anchor protein AmaP [Streptomyces sp. ME02-8801-2C]|uniref:alkaline shock response membrane anchor protein AmaP n=1 Tax=Streptomyces sp. ME02-8801-2C TaxID=3028680 RepID=UPI0029BA01C3|nr:alkaline shock response membrane anchor protein AmaP [Streptomyces sp. ME02-8801-2C]MDX3450691.1 alkaline shock response membrane anchor protein AmaP [Streptomyces sp. ME02-8801-2C]
MQRVVNRVLLGLAGLALIVVGGSVLAVGLGSRWPTWWIHDDRHDVLLSAAERTHYRDAGWWWPTVLAVLAALVLLSLWWLAAVLRRRRLTEVLVDTGDGEGALLRGRAMETAVAGEVARQEGVARARVTLTGRRASPEARVQLLLQPHASPGETLTRLTTEALTNARDSAGLKSLPTEVDLRAVKHRAERVN